MLSVRKLDDLNNYLKYICLGRCTIVIEPDNNRILTLFTTQVCIYYVFCLALGDHCCSEPPPPIKIHTKAHASMQE